MKAVERETRGQSPLALYLRQIRNVALLSADEEKRLARRIAAGDREAYDQMVLANLRLVVHIARAFVGRGLPLQDLIEEGNLGLLRAVKGFDPEMDTRFSTYAGFWIRQAIHRALINTTRPIRLPAHVTELLTKCNRASARLECRLNRTPTLEEVVREADIPSSKLNTLRNALGATRIAPQDDGELSSMNNAITDTRQKGPEQTLLERDDASRVSALLERMDARQATIVRMRFGLDDADPKSIKEIAECFGLTRERVRQLKNQALQTLATCMSH